jgi:hypothetical protein
MTIRGGFEEYEEVLHEVGRLCFMSSGVELQAEAIEACSAARRKAHEQNVEAGRHSDEGTANLALAYEMILECYESQLRMWVDLKSDKAHEAWDHLVNAEGSLSAALRICDGPQSHAGVAARLLLTEKILFPPQSFMSTGAIVEKARCSICGRDIEACDHVPGKAYMGQLCYQIIEKAKLLEVSLVDDPADKRCRVERFSDGQGWRDKLTRRFVPSEKMSSDPSCGH